MQWLVPPYFYDYQRQSIKGAVTVIDLNLLRIINEPISSAIIYGQKRYRKKYLVYNIINYIWLNDIHLCCHN